MLLGLLFLFWLIISPIVHCLKRQSPLTTFYWLSDVIKRLAKDRKFTIGLVVAVAVHFIGSRLLGTKVYNTSGFDILTHTAFGLLAREGLAKADKARPFISQIGSKCPNAIGKRVTPSTLAFGLCLAHEIQEEIQTIIPGLREMVYIVGMGDQIKDLIMDTIGIAISLNLSKGKAKTAFELLAVVSCFALFWLLRIYPCLAG